MKYNALLLDVLIYLFNIVANILLLYIGLKYFLCVYCHAYMIISLL